MVGYSTGRAASVPALIVPQCVKTLFRALIMADIARFLLTAIFLSFPPTFKLLAAKLFFEP
jgi:hypothetical protein